MKSRGGKRQEEKRREEKRREEKRREEKRREAKRSEEKRSEEKRSEEKRREEKRRREKINEEKESEEDPGVRKGRKVAKHCLFPMICGSRGSKRRLAKAAGAEPSGQMKDEKLRAVVAQSTFASEKTKNISRSEHFWKLRCRKSARLCGAQHMSKSKRTKQTMFRPLLEVDMSKKCKPLWREAHVQVKSAKNWGVRTTFGRSDVVFRGRYRGLCTLSKKKAKREGCLAFPKTIAGVGHLKIWKDAFSVAGAVQETCSSEMLGGHWGWFPETGCILEHQIFSFGKMILCDKCSTLYKLASLFRGRCNTSEIWTGKIAKRIGTRPSALHSTSHRWRKSRRIASFLMLPIAKMAEASQNSFVFNFAERQIDR